MDTDALLKLTLAGAKEAVVGAFQVLIPEAVYREAVVEGKAHGYDDALVLERNVQARRVQVAHAGDEPADAEDVLPAGGEREVYRLFRRVSASGGARVFIVSDDRRLLHRLRLLGTRPITPGAVLVLLAREGLATAREALGWLDALRRTISTAEYEVCRAALAAVHKREG
ncbi:MAG: hypothetical protein QN157_02235 [Armatimonadota bacterium]|nr:hypothetical protein [Armatimonadota bacterium]